MRNAAQALMLAVILALCGGLLTCGIVKVRDTAARLECMNNLRAIGGGLAHHHEARGYFPPAAVPNPGLPPKRRLSWQCELIAGWMIATDFRRRVDWEGAWDSEKNVLHASIPWRDFQCPTAYLYRDPATGLGPTHYPGVAGLGEDAATLPQGDRRAGFFGYERRLTRADLGGRTATLLVIVETAGVRGSWMAAGTPTARGLEEGGGRSVGAGAQFGGTHRGGANTLFADVSVRFIRESVDPRVLQAAAVLRGADKAGPVGDE